METAALNSRLNTGLYSGSRFHILPWIVVPTKKPVFSEAWRKVSFSDPASFAWGYVKGTKSIIIARMGIICLSTKVIGSKLRPDFGSKFLALYRSAQPRRITGPQQGFPGIAGYHLNLSVA